MTIGVLSLIIVVDGIIGMMMCLLPSYSSWYSTMHVSDTPIETVDFQDRDTTMMYK